MNVYKWKLHKPENGVIAVLVVAAADVDGARRFAEQYLRDRGGWTQWFWRVEPEVVDLSAPSVVAVVQHACIGNNI